MSSTSRRPDTDRNGGGLHRLAALAGGRLVAVHAIRFDVYGRGTAPRYNSLAEEDLKRALRDDVAAAGVVAQVRVLGDISRARALHRVA